MKILFTGGGTGGHVFPIIALSREIRKIYQGKNLQFFYIGPRDQFGQIFLSQEGIKVKEIMAGKIRRYSDWKSRFQNFIDLFIKIPLGILQSFIYIFYLAPDLIFSKGGYGSIPVVIAGSLLRTPIFLHESDVVPGLSNRFLSKLASAIFVSFPKTDYFKPSKIILVGNPIRREILESSKEEAQEFFKLIREKPIILILGGSQGSQRINDEIFEVLAELLKEFEIIHQVGSKNFKQLKAEAKVVVPKKLERYYHIFPFLKEEELRKAYSVSDLIIARAGSGIIFEIAAWGKPSILIPLPEAAQNHQLKNAYAFSQTGACQVLEESNFTSHFFLEKLKYLFSNPENLDKMAKAARKFAKPLAANKIAREILNYLK
jgi:UDP-N-acetylglucosamine--N-acetylmuramyl-(pentapeptide) pyrophosphoryl-undecaprenol N-acetylglucosamine transferase